MSSKQEITNPVIRWVDERLPVFSYMQHELSLYTSDAADDLPRVDRRGRRPLQNKPTTMH